MLIKPLTPAEVLDDRIRALSAPAPAFRRGAGRGWLRFIAAWIERARQRHALADLDDRLLRDVGITRGEAAREIAKPFWRR